MSNENTLATRIETVHSGTIAILDNLTEKAHVFELPEPSAQMEEFRRKLVANAYRVLVVGEAKRGKSSFINALIGRNILPTNVDIATCQVFRIHGAGREAYRLRFEDDSTQEIAAADLPRYGSQAMADVRGLPGLNTIIRWIEVDVPAHFLPVSVYLLDTPGLGSLYSAHAQITQRFVPSADAVIFVLDSLQPIMQSELEFIESILSVTPHIFFIQTKIDLQRREGWQALLQRNQAILQERFKDGLADTRIWPISSTNLLKAVRPGKKDDEDYLRASRYQEMAVALQVFLFHTAGWDRAVKAIQLAEGYYSSGRKTLVGRLAGMMEESEQKRTELQQRVLQRKQEFDHAWGERGQQRKELLERTRTIVATGRRTFLEALRPGGEIEQTERAKIDQFTSLEELRQYHKAMDAQVIGTVLERWQKVCQDAQDQCNKLLAEFLAMANALSLLEMASIANLPTKYAQEIKLHDDWAGISERAFLEGGIVEIVGSIFGLDELATLAGWLWAGIRAWFIRDDARLTEARKQLHEHLDQLLQTIRQKILGDEQQADTQNLIDAFFNALLHSMSEQIQQIVTQKSKDVQAELDRLAAEAKLDEQQRKAQAERVQEQLTAWDAVAQAIKDIGSDFRLVEQSLTESLTASGPPV